MRPRTDGPTPLLSAGARGCRRRRRAGRPRCRCRRHRRRAARGRGLEQWGDHGVELGDLLFEVGRRGGPTTCSAALVAAVTGSAERVGRSPLGGGDELGDREALERLCSWSGALKVSWRIWVSALIRASRAERLATTRTRMASTEPSLLLAVPWARPDRAARAASTASRGSDLPLWRRAWRFWRSTSMTSTPARARKRATPAP